ncbi:hypothetical protein HQ520_14520 [bacterium]|nr:hypothetical protein [bacterium]
MPRSSRLIPALFLASLLAACATLQVRPLEGAYPVDLPQSEIIRVLTHAGLNADQARSAARQVGTALSRQGAAQVLLEKNRQIILTGNPPYLHIQSADQAWIYNLQKHEFR